MAKKSSGVPRDVNQNAARIVALSTGQNIPEKVIEAEVQKRLRSQAASMLGKLGGSKGGRMRAKNLSREKRIEIARRAAQARWKNSS
jgi:hypothetical protein